MLSRALIKIQQVAKDFNLKQFQGYVYSEQKLVNFAPGTHSYFWRKGKAFRYFIGTLFLDGDSEDKLYICERDILGLLCKTVEQRPDIIEFLQPITAFENTVVCFQNVLYLLQEDRWYLHSDPNRPTHYRAAWFVHGNLDTQYVSLADRRQNMISTHFRDCCFLKVLHDQCIRDEETLQRVLAVAMGQFFHTWCPLLDLPRSVVLSGISPSGKSTFVHTVRQLADGWHTIDEECEYRPYLVEYLSLASLKSMLQAVNKQKPECYFYLYSTEQPLESMSETVKSSVTDGQCEWIEFSHKIGMDDRLMGWIQNELGTIFRMANLCYLQAVRNHQLTKLEQVQKALDPLIAMPLAVYDHVLSQYF